MNYILVYYLINAVISSFLCSITCFLIVKKSTKEMGKYKWILLNIQISAFVESLFWTIFFAPLLEPYPYFHVYCNGLLWNLLKMPVGVEWGASTLFHCVLFAAVMTAFTYRYFLLLPLSHSRLSQLIMKTSGISSYLPPYLTVLPLTYISAKAFLPTDETEKLLFEADSSYIVPEGTMTCGGLYAYIWGATLILGAVAQTSVGTFTVTHMSSIMRTSAISAKSARIHKEAIRSTLIQIAMMWGGCIVPTCMLAYGLVAGIKDVPRWFVEFGASFGVIWFSSKSINCSVAISFTTSPYRRYLLKKIGIAPKASVVMFSQTSGSGGSTI